MCWTSCERGMASRGVGAERALRTAPCRITWAGRVLPRRGRNWHVEGPRFEHLSVEAAGGMDPEQDDGPSCDVVLKGLITSVLLYPTLLCDLARRYRLVN